MSAKRSSRLVTSLAFLMVAAGLANLPALGAPPSPSSLTSPPPSPSTGPSSTPLAPPAGARASILANRPVAPIATEPLRDGVAPLPTQVEPSRSAAMPLQVSDGLTPPKPSQLVDVARMLAPFLVMLLPVAILMFTSYVRINIVLVLLRQALGSPQVPGNQVLAALALLLTALVMRPVAETVYTKGLDPYLSGRMSASAAWEAGTKPVKMFMIDQIERTNHQEYFWQLYELATPQSANQPPPVEREDFPLQVVAPAFLLSELTTALVIGFYIYLPFLVIDLVVSSVLAAMGLFMLPPSLIALPLKLILFVLADGWLLVATMLLRSFAS